MDSSFGELVNYARALIDLDLAPLILSSPQVKNKSIEQNMNKLSKWYIDKRMDRENDTQDTRFFKRLGTLTPLFYPTQSFQWVGTSFTMETMYTLQAAIKTP